MLSNPRYTFAAFLLLFASFSVLICPAYTHSPIPAHLNPHNSLSYPSSPAPRLARRKEDKTAHERGRSQAGPSGAHAAQHGSDELQPSREIRMHPDLYHLTRPPLHCNDDLLNPSINRPPHTHRPQYYRDRGVNFQQVCDTRCFCDEQSEFIVDCKRESHPGQPGYLLLLDCEAACRCERPRNL